MKLVAATTLAALLAATTTLAADCDCRAGTCDCCGLLSPAGMPSVAQGCYVGNGLDDRLIPLGFDSAGGWILELTLTEPGQCLSYKTEAMGAADRSCSFNNCDPGTGKCATDRLQEFRDKGFEIGSNHDVNRSAADFCWYMWEKKPGYFDTLQYTGDGSSPRIIPLEFTPDVVLVINESGTITQILKTMDMPENTSCLWDNGYGEGACHVIGVPTIGNTSITVSTYANVNTVVYNVFYWKAHPSYLVTGKYIGDGDSGGGTQALVADTQVISTPDCDVSYVMIAGQTDDGIWAECDKQRGTNVGTDIEGAGNIALEPYAQSQTSLDEESGITALTDGSFTVTGAPTFEHSCNDDGVTYYYWASCAPVSLPSVQNPVDWSTQSIDADWHLEEAQGAIRRSANIIGGCSADCDLSEVTAVGRDLVNYQEGLASADFDGGDQLQCAAGTCGDELNDPAGDVTWWCRARPGRVDVIQTMLGQSNMQYNMHCDSTTFKCVVRNEADDDSVTASVINGCAADTWAFYACTYDLSDNELTAYVNGVAGTPEAVGWARGSTNTYPFALGGNPKTGAGYWTGQLDDCGVDFSEWSDTSLCRLCSCTSTGRECACFSEDPDTYVDEGYNDSLCNGCTLPVCSTVTP